MVNIFSEKRISRGRGRSRATSAITSASNKPYETTGPAHKSSEGKGMRVWDQKGKDIWTLCPVAVWTVQRPGYGGESIANAVRRPS